MTKQELYEQAKEAYYNGEPIMTDLEFDTLEEELGLENKSYVGTHHQKAYTIKHPFIMGSLSKIQIKQSDTQLKWHEHECNPIDWSCYFDKVLSYLCKSSGFNKPDWYFEVGPKYDGCSFEVVIDKHLNLVSVSTRGDGNYGKDISHWFEDEWKKNFEPKLYDWYRNNLEDHEALFLEKFVIRGECLIKKSVFRKKYANDFTMPRSFVAGCLNQDWEGTDKQKEMRSDLSWVCYDYREVFENGVISEVDYTNMSNIDIQKYIPTYSHKYLPGVTAFEDGKMEFYQLDKLCANDFRLLYWRFNEYRHEFCEYELDGFVIKPGPMFRLQDGGRARQEDCVAIKFLPEIVDATLIDVEWNVGKTGEYYPIGILDEIILGGKKVNRVSLSNYGSIVEKGIGIGSKLRISLAGDIIPFVYEVVSNGTKMGIPDDSYVDGVHLMKTMSDDEKMYIKFINSVNVLKPEGIGEKVAEKLFAIMPSYSILDFMTTSEWKSELDDSKSSQNIIQSLNERKNTLTLPDMIQSLGFDNCGGKNALWLAKKMSGLDVDTKGIPTSIIELSEQESTRKVIYAFMDNLNIKPLVEESSDKIPVILTGSPKVCGYNTKSDFLSKHPEYVETTKWDECKILFTDDLNSTSSKMEKAKKKGIDIKRYE